MSPALARLLAEAAPLLELDAATASEFARSSALLIDGVAVVAFSLAAATPVGIDAMVVASLGDVRMTNLLQAQVVLHTAMLLGPIGGFTIGATADGELQVFRGLALQAVDGETLARVFVQLAKVAGSIRSTLEDTAS